MSESKPEVTTKKQRWDAEFKQNAVRLITDQGYTFKTAAKAVGVSEQTLRTWHAKLAPAPVPCGEHATVSELRDEISRLRKQLHRTELEREI